MPVSRLNRKIRLRDLDTLVAVVRTGGVRKAAEFLHLSQPAVSRAISDLEASLGVVLLDRSRRGVAVTPFGEALLRRTVTVFDELQMAVDEIEHLADPSGGNVHMGCMATLCSGIVARATEHLAHRYPRLRLRIETADSPHLIDYFLRERICEFVIARPYALPLDSGILSEPLWHDRLRVVVGRDNPYARRRRMALADLVQSHWLLSSNEVKAGSPVAEAFGGQGLPLPALLTVSNSLSMRISLLTTGPFVTVMPQSLLHFLPQRLSLRVLPIEVPPWRAATMILTLRDRRLGPAAEIVLDTLRTLAKPLADPVP
ncbi:MAG: LysR family transcriptional regulator [Burkholderiaceae bacterium]|nr:LysR family transcriptional regulator [Burkholderiaceae bacterium]